VERQRGFAGEAVSLVGVEGGGGVFDVVSSWRPVGFLAVLLVVLNFFDVVATFYGVGVLGFVELNSLAVGFPVWVFLFKFGVCFVPVVCAYALEKFGMGKYLVLPFVFSAVLVEFYAFVVAFNVGTLLGA